MKNENKKTMTAAELAKFPPHPLKNAFWTDRALAGFHNGKISKEIRHKVVLLDAE